MSRVLYSLWPISSVLSPLYYRPFCFLSYWVFFRNQQNHDRVLGSSIASSTAIELQPSFWNGPWMHFIKQNNAEKKKEHQVQILKKKKTGFLSLEDEVSPCFRFLMHFWPFTWISVDNSHSSSYVYIQLINILLSKYLATFTFLHYPRFSLSMFVHEHGFPCLHCQPQDYIRMVKMI